MLDGLYPQVRRLVPLTPAAKDRRELLFSAAFTPEVLSRTVDRQAGHAGDGAGR